MKTRSQITCASLALLIAGSSLLYTTPTLIVKAEPTQSVSSSVQTSTQRDRNSVKQAVRDTLQLGFPGILAKTSEGGKTWSYAAGVANLSSKKPMKTDFRFRIGSVTKTFTATVVLQLAEENRLNLDDSIEKWLPGVIQGNGYDDKQITIRQLLNHTSGIAEYTRSKSFDLMDTKKSYRAEELVKMGISMPPDFAPGKSWSYSNTGYVLLGILIETVTGNSYAEEIENRIIEPLELSNTFLPGNSSVIPGTKHARGYIQLDGASEPKDVTYYNPSMGSSAGDMISTADDLNKFFSYLLGGKLLKEQQLKQMLTTVPTGEAALGRYGLGIYETKLPNGVSIWGHGGSIPGFVTFAGGTLGGKHTLAVNLNSLNAESPDPFKNILLAEFSK
ncbi:MULTISPECIES: serine hydrolase domain-containing protein [Bacillus cereus group]|uniref:serine hydrolase domain-containing protein n=1 Tax=Bacillus cereus group TaxID=86661 RepID=UPI000BEB500B|nr:MULTISPECIES: serine hydrolase domain-containing protein [Bacillus cereus group]MBJ7932849.1 beta-lactamase family protein [Bacillus cereus group sp. N31]PEG15490.1 D-alanyl-D-alanine carboxypeptidase [Bacillus toyonensis]PHG00203.1 D-alanyl-D-alanine carboxypeptidase [Bacillus toyonensis]QWH92280.1 class A beta-lactamase-related serine hydrolase [Bacillus toyonensis]QWI35470.1 class A beta-lactamase-related serine hydrolase [Bacillus toyonensis]